MSTWLPSQAGTICPKCHIGKLVLCQHGPRWKPSPRRSYYFAQWLRCPTCRTPFMIESSKHFPHEFSARDSARKPSGQTAVQRLMALEGPSGGNSSETANPSKAAERMPVTAGLHRITRGPISSVTSARNLVRQGSTVPKSFQPSATACASST